jgi:hypothetical protein
MDITMGMEDVHHHDQLLTPGHGRCPLILKLSSLRHVLSEKHRLAFRWLCEAPVDMVLPLKF